MSIVLNSKTYNFDGFLQTGISSYTERAGGVPSSYSPLTCKVDGVTGNGAVKVRWKLKLPVVATEDTACTCAGTVLRNSTVDLVLTLDRGLTATERSDVLARLQDLVLKPEFTGSVSNLRQPNA